MVTELLAVAAILSLIVMITGSLVVAVVGLLRVAVEDMALVVIRVPGVLCIYLCLHLHLIYGPLARFLGKQNILGHSVSGSTSASLDHFFLPNLILVCIPVISWYLMSCVQQGNSRVTLQCCISWPCNHAVLYQAVV